MGGAQGLYCHPKEPERAPHPLSVGGGGRGDLWWCVNEAYGRASPPLGRAEGLGRRIRGADLPRTRHFHRNEDAKNAASHNA